MAKLLIMLNMDIFQFLMDCVLLITLLISCIAFLIIKKKNEGKPQSVTKMSKVEVHEEKSRRQQEEDELTAIMNAENTDEEYNDDDFDGENES